TERPSSVSGRTARIFKPSASVHNSIVLGVFAKGILEYSWFTKSLVSVKSTPSKAFLVITSVYFPIGSFISAGVLNTTGVPVITISLDSDCSVLISACLISFITHHLLSDIHQLFLH